MFLPSNITLEPGDTGDYVRELQRRLNQRDLLSEISINGYYDGITTDAVRSFQMMSGLKSDGIAGPDTIRRLSSFGAASSGDEESASDGDKKEESEIEMMGARFDEFMAAGLVGGGQITNDSILDPLRDKEGHEVDEYRSHSHDQDKHHALWEGKEYTKEQAKDDLMAKMEKDSLANRQVQRDLESLDKLHNNERQLEFTREGVQARTLDKDLKEDLGKNIDQQAHTREQMLAIQRDGGLVLTPQQIQQQQAATELAGQRGQERPGQGEEIRLQQNQQRGPQLQQQNGQANGMAPNQQQQAGLQQTGLQQSGPQRDPALIRTERQLSPGDAQASTQQGHRLEANGVRDAGMPPGTRLGELSPSQTPARATQREVGIG